MNSNALNVMIVPIIRGIFVFAILGGAAVGLARMLGAVAACLWAVGDPAPTGAARGPAPATEASLEPAEESLATAGA
jgi:hypothetical protein